MAGSLADLILLALGAAALVVSMVLAIIAACDQGKLGRMTERVLKDRRIRQKQVEADVRAMRKKE